jgi:hypothetical protein
MPGIVFFVGELTNSTLAFFDPTSGYQCIGILVIICGQTNFRQMGKKHRGRNPKPHPI